MSHVKQVQYLRERGGHEHVHEVIEDLPAGVGPRYRAVTAEQLLAERVRLLLRRIQQAVVAQHGERL